MSNMEIDPFPLEVSSRHRHCSARALQAGRWERNWLWFDSKLTNRGENVFWRCCYSGRTVSYYATNWEHDKDTGCWNWLGPFNRDGYGQLRVNGYGHLAHRFVYWCRYPGVDISHLTLDHLCCNRACVNPYHLEPVTAVENIMRMHHRRRERRHDRRRRWH